MFAGLFSYHFVHMYIVRQRIGPHFSASVAASINTAMKGVPEQTRRKGDNCDEFKGSPEEASRSTLQER